MASENNGILNIEAVKEHEKELANWTEYIPLVLLKFIDRVAYFNRWSDDAKKKYHQTRQEQPSDRTAHKEYMENDLKNWVKQYPQFNDILME